MQALPEANLHPRYHLHCADLGVFRKLVLSGRLDVDSVAQLETRFFASAVAPGKPVLIDLRGVEHLACTAIGMLRSTARALGRRKLPMVVISTAPVLGLECRSTRDAVAVVPSEQEALARLKP